MSLLHCFDTVGWIRAIAVKSLCRLSTEVLFQSRWRKNAKGEPVDLGSPWKLAVNMEMLLDTSGMAVVVASTSVLG